MLVQFAFFDQTGANVGVTADVQRVPVVGDTLSHEETEYTVGVVVLYTDGSRPYVVARVPVV